MRAAQASPPPLPRYPLAPGPPHPLCHPGSRASGYPGPSPTLRSRPSSLASMAALAPSLLQDEALAAFGGCAWLRNAQTSKDHLG